MAKVLRPRVWKKRSLATTRSLSSIGMSQRGRSWRMRNRSLASVGRCSIFSSDSSSKRLLSGKRSKCGHRSRYARSIAKPRVAACAVSTSASCSSRSAKMPKATSRASCARWVCPRAWLSIARSKCQRTARRSAVSGGGSADISAATTGVASSKTKGPVLLPWAQAIKSNAMIQQYKRMTRQSPSGTRIWERTLRARG